MGFLDAGFVEALSKAHGFGAVSMVCAVFAAVLMAGGDLVTTVGHTCALQAEGRMVLWSLQACSWEVTSVCRRIRGVDLYGEGWGGESWGVAGRLR